MLSSPTRRSPRPSPHPSVWEQETAWSLPFVDRVGEKTAQGSDEPEDGEPEDGEPKTSHAARRSTATTDATGAGAPPTPRSRTPSFVCAVPLRVPPHEEQVLLTRLQAARALYNACLGEARRRWRLVQASRAYQHARRLPKHSQERRDAFRVARAAQSFSDAALQAYAKDCRHDAHWIEDHLDAPVCQKLASRAYHAVLRVAIRKAKRIRFKGKPQLATVEGKSNATGLVWRSDRVVWKGLTLRAYLPKVREGQTLAQQDPVLAHGLASQVKYVRLVRRTLRGRNRCFAQLIGEGTPYHKPNHTLGAGIVGLDLGPSTIALNCPHHADRGGVAPVLRRPCPG